MKSVLNKKTDENRESLKIVRLFKFDQRKKKKDILKEEKH